MAPQVVSAVTDPQEDPQEKHGRTLEVYYKGWFYDITEFVHRHPGGSVIKFYTERGEDASQAIEQFHYRSRAKVDQILKSFKKRKAGPDELGLKPDTLTKHEALSADFKVLFEELQAEGYFEPCIRHVILRVIECVTHILIAYGIALRQGPLLYMICASCYFGFALSRFGWLQHEAGHRSLTGNRKVDQFIQDLSVCLVTGGSSIWWNSQHNRHHAMPQRLHHDVDLSTLPFVAFHKRTVRKREEINGFFVRFQGIFYWTIDLFLVTILWRFFLHPRYQLKKKAYFELALSFPTLYFIYHFHPIWYFIAGYWMAFFLGVNFALNHSHLEVADKPTHWIEYSLTHTVNITGNMVVDYWMGFLNYQIEHHLFPTMPQFRNKEVSHRVKALAEKHGLPYRILPYGEAVYTAVKNLDDVGKILTSKEHYENPEVANI